jgi:hypothetical protein
MAAIAAALMAARTALASAHAPVAADLELADQRRQRQALADQRGGDDEEGQEDDQVAVREGAAAGQRGRQGQRGGQRDDAAHAAPADDAQLALARARLGGAQRAGSASAAAGRRRTPRRSAPPRPPR